MMQIGRQLVFMLALLCLGNAAPAGSQAVLDEASGGGVSEPVADLLVGTALILLAQARRFLRSSSR
jgi:hypothetical protein